jgi:hypothetical protein
MDLEAIEKKLSPLENALTRLGASVSKSLSNVTRSPELTCINNGVIVERILHDLWRRLGSESLPEGKGLNDLHTVTTKKLKEEGIPMPRGIGDYILEIANCRNWTVQSRNATPQDAMVSMSKVYEVAHWYFTTFLPTRDKADPVPPAGPAAAPLFPPNITVIKPSEGEQWEPEARQTIRWKATPGGRDTRIAGVGLELWNGNARVESIAGGGARVVRERQSFDWNVPAILKPGDQ